MRDISNKIVTQRVATARSSLSISPETVQKLENNELPKGNPLDIAKVAAVQAAKNTATIIPYCHPIPIDWVEVVFEVNPTRIAVQVTVKANAKTGVEMEALTGASVAALTLYDMMKMVDESMRIEETVLIRKTGGKSDFRQLLAKKLKAAVLVMSDSIAEGRKTDRSGRLIEDRLKSLGIDVVDYRVIPDDPNAIGQTLMLYTDEQQLDLVVTTGGTGVSPRDNTPEVMQSLLDLEIPGIGEVMRSYGQNRTPYAMLSRSMAGIREKTLIINLPGSTGGVEDSLDALFPAVLHVFKMMWGYGHDAQAKHSPESKPHAHI